MNPEPVIRQRALLRGVSAAAWVNWFSLAVIGFILALVLIGATGQPWMIGREIGHPIAIAFAVADASVLVVSGAMVFIRLTAERTQGYTTIDGLRLGRGATMVPGIPDVVDTVESRTGVVLRDAGDAEAGAEVMAARMRVARQRIRTGERPILLDRRK